MNIVKFINKKSLSAGFLLMMLVVSVNTAFSAKKKSDDKDQLVGNIVFATDSKAFIKYMKAAKKSGKFSIPESVTKVSRGKEVFVFVFFSGCKADSKTKKCNSTISFKVVKPNKKVYADFKNLVLWKGKPVKKGVARLGDVQFGILPEKKDPKGEYKVVATLTDKVAKKTINFVRTFTVK